MSKCRCKKCENVLVNTPAKKNSMHIRKQIYWPIIYEQYLFRVWKP